MRRGKRDFRLIDIAALSGMAKFGESVRGSLKYRPSAAPFILPNLIAQDRRYINCVVLHTISSSVGVKVISGVEVRDHEVRVRRVRERSVEISKGDNPWELRSGVADPSIQRPALRRTRILRARIDVTGVRIFG